MLDRTGLSAHAAGYCRLDAGVLPFPLRIGGKSHMAYWLFKEDPDHYRYEDLERDGSTLWEGVKNSLARAHLRKVCRGDRIWYYHTGHEKAVVGEMRALADACTVGTRDDPKAVAVQVEAVRALSRPVTLAEIKKEPRLASWDLVRLPRLSVLPVSASQWQRIEELSQS
jgi:predicted RNA-binding protein with PUA-like domain